MHLTHFTIKGFKNFREAVSLEDLGKICVIHGDNNVGKSNVLAAMQLFFQILRNFPRSSLWVEKISTLDLEKLGVDPNHFFNLELPKPIELSATFNIDANELEQADIQPLLPSSQVQIAIQLTQRKFEYRVTKYQFADGTDLVQPQSHHSSEMYKYGTDLAIFLAETLPRSNQRFVLIKLNRRILQEDLEEQLHNIVPQGLRLQLYDAKESENPALSQKWKLFVRIMKKFNDILGEGEMVAIFNRHTNRATLVFETPSTRIPIDLLGSGIQQVVALIARLLMSNATLIAIEEPELNLRYTLQLRLREIFREIVADPAGPQQIFLTSHSPAFEVGEYFYAISKINGIPQIERRPIKNASLFTQHSADSPFVVGESAPLCYVSTDGLVKLPERICEFLQLKQGGGVVFVENKQERIEMLTNDQYFDLFEEPVEDE